MIRRALSAERPGRVEVLDLARLHSRASSSSAAAQVVGERALERLAQRRVPVGLLGRGARDEQVEPGWSSSGSSSRSSQAAICTSGSRRSPSASASCLTSRSRVPVLAAREARREDLERRAQPAAGDAHVVDALDVVGVEHAVGVDEELVARVVTVTAAACANVISRVEVDRACLRHAFRIPRRRVLRARLPRAGRPRRSAAGSRTPARPRRAAASRRAGRGRARGAARSGGRPPRPARRPARAAHGRAVRAVQLGADDAPQRRRAAADGVGHAGLRRLEALEDAATCGAHARRARRPRAGRAQVAVGQERRPTGTTPTSSRPRPSCRRPAPTSRRRRRPRRPRPAAACCSVRSRRRMPAAPRRRREARRRACPRLPHGLAELSRLAAWRIAAVATTRIDSTPAFARHPDLRGDELGDLGDLARRGSRRARRAQRVNARCAITSCSASVARLRHEQPRRVRADVDAGAAHRTELGMMRRVSTSPAIEVHGLRKAYGEHEAVRGIDFTVGRGEVFGLLGPNGAGKTTTVEILEGYRTRDAGDVAVLGFDPQRRERALRERLGIVLQSCGFDRHLTPREMVTHWATLYPHPRDPDEVIALVGLRGEAGRQRAQAVRRPAAAAGPGAGAGRRPGADLPRRADDRLRPGGAARRLGHDPLAARPRQDGGADHALPRRGPGAGRPRGDHQGRARSSPIGHARASSASAPRSACA